MELETFDAFTRRLKDAGSRRQALRALGSVLFGSALGGVAVRLGLVRDAEAKSQGKKRAKKRAKKRITTGKHFSKTP